MGDRAPGTWQVLVVGSLPPSLVTWLADRLPGSVAGLAPCVQEGLEDRARWPPRPPPPGHADAPVDLRDARRLIRKERRRWRQRGGAAARDPPVLLLTGRPLVSAECSALMGVTDRRRRTILLSAHGLGCPEEPGRLATRMGNLLAHELGHLQGWGHCDRPHCLMTPAREPADLDRRRFRPCVACRPGRGRGR